MNFSPLQISWRSRVRAIAPCLHDGALARSWGHARLPIIGPRDGEMRPPPKMLVHQGMRLAPAACPDPISRWMLSRFSATSNGSWCNPLPNNRYFACRSEGTRRLLDALCLKTPGPASLKRHTVPLCLTGLPRTRSIGLCAAVVSRGVAFSGTL